jgi:hypothetical protein
MPHLLVCVIVVSIRLVLAQELVDGGATNMLDSFALHSQQLLIG